MTRIDFYVLKDHGRDASTRFACRLSCRALSAGMPIHIHTRDHDDAAALDALLWDYPQHRFVPHDNLTTTPTPRAPVHIGHAAPLHTSGLLINLHDDVPEFFGRFDRVAEIVVEETKSQSRTRYAHYRHRGYPLHNHQLDEWEREA